MQIMQNLPVKFALQKQSTPHDTAFLPEELWDPFVNTTVLLLQNQYQAFVGRFIWHLCGIFGPSVYWPALPGIL